MERPELTIKVEENKFIDINSIGIDKEVGLDIDPLFVGQEAEIDLTGMLQGGPEIDIGIGLDVPEIDIAGFDIRIGDGSVADSGMEAIEEIAEATIEAIERVFER
jgi:hypothetical protein